MQTREVNHRIISAIVAIALLSLSACSGDLVPPEPSDATRTLTPITPAPATPTPSQQVSQWLYSSTESGGTGSDEVHSAGDRAKLTVDGKRYSHSTLLPVYCTGPDTDYLHPFMTYSTGSFSVFKTTLVLDPALAPTTKVSFDIFVDKKKHSYVLDSETRETVTLTLDHAHTIRFTGDALVGPCYQPVIFVAALNASLEG